MVLLFSVVEMAIIRQFEKFSGVPDILFSALQRAESSVAEGDGPQSGTRPRSLLACTPFNRKYVYPIHCTPCTVAYDQFY